MNSHYSSLQDPGMTLVFWVEAVVAGWKIAFKFSGLVARSKAWRSWRDQARRRGDFG